MRSHLHGPLGREYVSLQAVSCYFASFLYLLGYSLLIGKAEVWATPFACTSLVISLCFLLIAFALTIAGFAKVPPRWAESVLRRLGSPIDIASIGCIAVAWLSSIQLIPHNSLLFPFFFYGGFLCMIALFVRYVYSRWR